MLNRHLTTNQLFCCNTYGALVSLELINADDLAYVCQNPHCQRVVSVDCPEALHIRETLELPTRATVEPLFVV